MDVVVVLGTGGRLVTAITSPLCAVSQNADLCILLIMGEATDFYQGCRLSGII